MTEGKETAPNTDTMISSEEQLDSSFSNEKDETFSAPLTQSQAFMDSLPNTSAASAVFQEEPQIPLEKFPSPVQGFFNGGAISRTEPPAQKFGTPKPSQGVNGKFIAELMSNPNLSDRITSFFIKDPKVSEYAAKGAQLFQELKTKYPDQFIPLPFTTVRLKAF